MLRVGRTLKGHFVQSHPSCAAPGPFPAVPLKGEEGDFSPFQEQLFPVQPVAPGSSGALPSRSQQPGCARGWSWERGER